MGHLHDFTITVLKTLIFGELKERSWERRVETQRHEKYCLGFNPLPSLSIPGRVMVHYYFIEISHKFT